MNLIGVALAMGSVVVGLASCGSDAPPPRTEARAGFDMRPHSERVFAAYRQTGDRTVEVTFPAGSRGVDVRLDCAGARGRVDVSMSDAGGASAQCRPTSAGRPGFVSLQGDGSLLRRDQTVTITGPGDQQWSVAIDAFGKVMTE